MKICGLKPSRYSEWAEVVRADLNEIPLRSIARLACAMLRSSMRPHVDSVTWGSRLRKCHRCVFFEQELKRCHLVDLASGQIYGCSCYMPFKALFSGHGWAFENVEDGEAFCW